MRLAHRPRGRISKAVGVLTVVAALTLSLVPDLRADTTDQGVLATGEPAAAEDGSPTTGFTASGELHDPLLPEEPRKPDDGTPKLPIPTKWRTCSHLAPWNGVYFDGDLGAAVTEVRKIRCRRAARVLTRAELTEDRLVRIRRWKCRSDGEASYGVTYTECQRRINGRTKRIKVIVGH